MKLEVKQFIYLDEKWFRLMRTNRNNQDGLRIEIVEMANYANLRLRNIDLDGGLERHTYLMRKGGQYKLQQ